MDQSGTGQDREKRSGAGTTQTATTGGKAHLTVTSYLIFYSFHSPLLLVLLLSGCLFYTECNDRQGTFFFALESGRPEFWKIRSTLLLGPRISNRGPKEKLKERNRARYTAARQAPTQNIQNHGRPIKASRLLRRRSAERHRRERRGGRYRQLPQRDAAIEPLRPSCPKECVFKFRP